MPSGQVNAYLEPMVQVTIHGPTGISRTLPTLVDTGFGGALTLPVSVIRVLALPLSGRIASQLADGTLKLFDVYQARIEWDGSLRSIDIQVADAQPLLGTGLLSGHDLVVRMTAGGSVGITAIP